MDIEIMTHRLWRLWRRLTGQQAFQAEINEQRGAELLAALHDQGLDAIKYCSKTSRLRLVFAVVRINPDVYLHAHISNVAHFIFGVPTNPIHQLSLYVHEQQQENVAIDLLEMREITPAWVKTNCEVPPDVLTNNDVRSIIHAINDARVYLYGP